MAQVADRPAPGRPAAVGRQAVAAQPAVERMRVAAAA
jgi:hypothetical protein